LTNFLKSYFALFTNFEGKREGTDRNNRGIFFINAS
jgi:hypothetical protein